MSQVSRIAHDPTTERRPLVQAGGFSIPEKIYHNSRKVKAQMQHLQKKIRTAPYAGREFTPFPFPKKKMKETKRQTECLPNNACNFASGFFNRRG